ncbi:MAG TPA: methylated-DNA--[protein]-cysteine S-methyltransferase [Kofleriaceae bacterium]
MITLPSPLGVLRLYGHADELIGVWLPDSDDLVPAHAKQASTPVLRATAKQLEEYFAGERRAFDLPLAPRGTGFQQLVWRALTAIPFGETRSYGELARAIGRPSASRAVGAANGKNPISIIVPCHRVIGASGDLTGYGGGLPAKRWLLAHEARFTQQAQTSFAT